MNKVRFAVIGCGMFARQTHLPNLTALDEADLHICCDISESNLEACKAFQPRRLTPDYLEAVNDPEIDAVIVATTESFRVPIIEAAIKARKPVYCEKPLADSLDNALHIQKLAEDNPIPFCVGHNRRCSPAMVAARNIFAWHMRQPRSCSWRFEREGWEKIPVGQDDGAPVVAIRINDDWRSWKSVHLENELNRRVGLVLSEGTHFADLATWFIDAEPISVFCTGQGVLNHSISIKYRNGGLATITMASTGTLAYPKELLEAIGHGGLVAVDHMLEVRTAGIPEMPPLTRYPMLGDRHPHIGVAGGLAGWLEKKRAACEEAAQSMNPMKQFTAEPDKGHKSMLREFIREIRGERGPVCPPASAVTAMKVCLTAAKSLTEERVVKISEIGRSA